MNQQVLHGNAISILIRQVFRKHTKKNQPYLVMRYNFFKNFFLIAHDICGKNGWNVEKCESGLSIIISSQPNHLTTNLSSILLSFLYWWWNLGYCIANRVICNCIFKLLSLQNRSKKKRSKCIHLSFCAMFFIWSCISRFYLFHVNGKSYEGHNVKDYCFEKGMSEYYDY